MNRKSRLEIRKHYRIMVIILLLVVLYGAYAVHTAQTTIEQNKLYQKQVER
jgi:uncharacterized membrane protein YgdD (TMEM256/DUF423 family)